MTGAGIKVKLGEIEAEVWDAYRIADSLGVVIDSSYTVKQPEEVDVGDIVGKVLKHFASEAAERHVKLDFNPTGRACLIWGELSGIEQAVSQLISNAIKYSFGGNTVQINVAGDRDEVIVNVASRGVPLPSGVEEKKIWDFGYRGSDAKQLHVNGSGIGLYSVKRIVSAHRGWVHVRAEGNSTEFGIHLPSKSALKRDLGILI